MNNIDELIHELKESIQNEPLFKEYFKLKKIVENDEYINQLQLKIKFLKKCKMSKEEKDEYNKCINELNNIPVYHNYLEVEKMVSDYKIEIKNILEVL